MIEKIIGADKQGKKTQGHDATSPVIVRTGLPRILVFCPVIYSDKAPGSKGQKGSKESRWTPIGMIYIIQIKQALLTYDLHSTCVKEMIKTWASGIKATLHDFFQLVSAILDDGPQLMFKIYFKEKSQNMKQRKSKRF